MRISVNLDIAGVVGMEEEGGLLGKRKKMERRGGRSVEVELAVASQTGDRPENSETQREVWGESGKALGPVPA